MAAAVGAAGRPRGAAAGMLVPDIWTSAAAPGAPCPADGKREASHVNPNSDLSPVALTVMAVVVVVLAGAWLGLVFFAARQPRTGGAHPGKEDVARAPEPEVIANLRDMPAEPHVRRRQPDSPHGRPVTTARRSRCRMTLASPGERVAMASRPGVFPRLVASIINC